MNHSDIIKALERAEGLLSTVDDQLESGVYHIGNVQHNLNNARQILAGLKVVVENEIPEPPEPDLMGHDYREDIHR